MDAIMFVPAPGPSVKTAEVDAYDEDGADVLTADDVLWLVTRLPDERQTPAVCGRLMVRCVSSPTPGEAAADPSHGGHARRIAVDPSLSERCSPFPCDVIRSWPIWRNQFTGVVALTDEQGVSLQAFWRNTEGRRGHIAPPGQPGRG